MTKFILAHLYPAEMNIYGDRGNVMTLAKRLAWRGYQLEVVEVEPGVRFDLRRADFVFGGGGQDKGQDVIAHDLAERADQLRQAARDGVVMLAICGTYQLFGHEFVTASGHRIAGAGIFDMTTNGSDQRMIGNVVADSPYGRLVGFENHSGQTELAADQVPLATVSKGYGNNSHGRDEGALVANTFGTYLHGPLLPKNPALADELLRRAGARRGLDVNREPLDDSLELAAAEVATTRPQ